jgi:hypothetical protein
MIYQQKVDWLRKLLYDRLAAGEILAATDSYHHLIYSPRPPAYNRSCSATYNGKLTTVDTNGF